MERFKYSENIESNKLSLLVFWRHSLAVNLLKRYVVWALSIPSYLSSPMYPRITSWDAENVVLFVFCLHLPQCYIKGATQRIYTIFFLTVLSFFSKDFWFQIHFFLCLQSESKKFVFPQLTIAYKMSILCYSNLFSKEC